MSRFTLIAGPIIQAINRLHLRGLGLINPYKPEEVVFQGQQIQQPAVEPPSQTADQSTGNGIQNEMIGSGYDSHKNGKRVQEAKH
jgi:hypothetical protein